MCERVIVRSGTPLKGESAFDATGSTDAHIADPADGAELFCDEHYRTYQRAPGEHANPLLVETAEQSSFAGRLNA